jgi:hypothetical protein
MNIDLYEMTYRNYKCFEKNKPDTNISVSERTKKFVKNTILEFEHIESEDIDEIKFSDVICNVFPVFDEKTHNLSYRSEFMFIDGNKENDPNEYVERFNKLDINTLPLIEVAKYLGIQVEKSNILEPYGVFKPSENKIILGSDYIPTFLHELAHAVDHILGKNYEKEHLSKYDEELDEDEDEDISLEYDFGELVAELSAVVLCKTYNISIDLSYAMYYLDGYSRSDINVSYMIERVALICEYVDKCVENIREKQRL